MKKLETVYNTVYSLPDSHPFVSLLVGSALLGACFVFIYTIYWMAVAIMLDVADKVSGAAHINSMFVLTFEILMLSAYLYKKTAKNI